MLKFILNEMESQRFDVIVIGDGPAGSTVALKLSKFKNCRCRSGLVRFKFRPEDLESFL